MSIKNRDDWKEMIGERILLKEQHCHGLMEVTVLELSPSEKYIKVSHPNGSEGWEQLRNDYGYAYEFVEVLNKPPEETKESENSELLEAKTR